MTNANAVQDFQNELTEMCLQKVEAMAKDFGFPTSLSLSPYLLDLAARIYAASVDKLPDDEDDESKLLLLADVESILFLMYGGADAPDDFWLTNVGRTILRAIEWARGENLLSLTEAASEAGIRLNTLSQWVSRRKVKTYLCAEEKNPQRRRRVFLTDVQKVKVKA